jgi:GNAT superfamily N-acetyltransferase
MNIMSLPLSGRPAIPTSRNPDIVARVTGTDEAELWARTAAEGARDLPEVADLMLDLARISAARLSAVLFLAEIDGRPIAAGALCTHRGVALLAGASTIPEARKQGAQNALLERRLHYAEDSGCDLAMICAEPGSSSQRNAERHGFRIAYTRIKWHLHQYHCG